MKYSTPVQQRQIIRIACLVPWVSIISFLSIWLETAGPYIAPALDFGAALALSAFLFLLCDYVLASRYGFNELFGDGALERGQYAGNSPPWLKVCWYASNIVLPGYEELTWLGIENMVPCPPIHSSQHHTMDCDSGIVGGRHILREVEQAVLCAYLGKSTVSWSYLYYWK